VSALFGMFNDTALVLGYLVLIIWVMFIIWVGIVLVRELKFDSKKKKHEEKEWDNIRSRWLTDMKNDERYTVQPDAYTTDILDFTVDDVYNYQEDKRRDAS
jgi:hypothetical protein